MGDSGHKAIKPATSHTRQLDLLSDYGFLIDGYANESIDALRYANYYMYKGYFHNWLHKDKLRHPMPIEHLFRLVEFDAKLKSLLFSLISRVEISFRAHIAYELSHAYGPLGYRDKANFVDEESHATFLAKAMKEASKSKEVFVKHYNAEYGGAYPIWIVVEIIPFGDLSCLYSNLHDDMKRKIAKTYYNIDSDIVRNWLSCLTVMRNICAHNSRLYSKGLPKNFRIINDDRQLIADSGMSFKIYPNTVFAALLALKHLIKDVDWYDFLVKFMCCLKRYSDVIELKSLGIPYGWLNYMHQSSSCGINSCRKHTI